MPIRGSKLEFKIRVLDKMRQGGEKEAAEKNRISNPMKPNEIYVGM